MPIWKQALITIAVIAIALAAWLRFVPGAGETLARLGIDWVPFAVADTRTDDRQVASGNRGGQTSRAASDDDEREHRFRHAATGTRCACC